MSAMPVVHEGGILVGNGARPWIRYACAVLASVLAVTLRLELHALWGSKAIYSTLYPAVAATALIAGLGPGLLATALCTAAVAHLWVSGHISLSAADEEKVAPLVFFAVMGTLISILSETIHRSRRRAAAAADAERRARIARDEVLAIVAHDLKNPLNIMSLQVELMERAIDPPRRSVATLRRSIDTMSRLIADLLDASALEAGKLRLETREADIVAVARGAVEAQGTVARAREIRMESRLPPDPIRVRCDPERIAQALGNLLGNALKFTPAGGVVSASVDALPDGVRIEVADSGPGIEAERLATVFQRYERGRRATGGETGLGLYIARGIAEAHGGRIGVRSRPGAGTTFWIELPTRLGAEAPQAYGAPPRTGVHS